MAGMMDTIELMTPGEVAKVLRTNEPQLANLRSDGKGPPWIRNGGRVLYRSDKLMAWIDAGGDRANEGRAA